MNTNTVGPHGPLPPTLCAPCGGDARAPNATTGRVRSSVPGLRLCSWKGTGCVIRCWGYGTTCRGKTMSEQKEMPLDVPQVVVDDLPWSYRDYEDGEPVVFEEGPDGQPRVGIRHRRNWPAEGKG